LKLLSLQDFSHPSRDLPLPGNVNATTSPSTIWVRLDGLDLADVASVQVIDPYDETLSGDVTSRLAPPEIAF